MILSNLEDEWLVGEPVKDTGRTQRIPHALLHLDFLLFFLSHTYTQREYPLHDCSQCIRHRPDMIAPILDNPRRIVSNAREYKHGHDGGRGLVHRAQPLSRRPPSRSGRRVRRGPRPPHCSLWLDARCTQPSWRTQRDLKMFCLPIGFPLFF